MSGIGDRVLRWSERLRAIAQTGLAFRPQPYDVERYEEILQVAAEMQGCVLGEEEADLFDAWRANVRPGPRGYVTPQVSVIAAVLNPNGELLLIKRPDTNSWFPPSGWGDVGRSASETAVKEVWEETGYRVQPIKLIGCYDSIVRGMSNFHFYCLFLGCRLLGGTLRKNDLEALEVAWLPRDKMPAPLHGGDWWVEPCFSWQDPDFEARFDL